MWKEEGKEIKIQQWRFKPNTWYRQVKHFLWWIFHRRYSITECLYNNQAIYDRMGHKQYKMADEVGFDNLEILHKEGTWYRTTWPHFEGHMRYRLRAKSLPWYKRVYLYARRWR